MAMAKIARERDAQEKKKNELNLKILKAGDAVNFPKKWDSIAMHYVGYLEDGTMFDNSYSRGQPVYFVYGAGQVIPGWESALHLLSKGEKASITIPHSLAYGERGYPPVIPPKATLRYEIELISFSASTHMNVQERVMKDKRGERSGSPDKR